jgi:hypothetical protein
MGVSVALGLCVGRFIAFGTGSDENSREDCSQVVVKMPRRGEQHQTHISTANCQFALVGKRPLP